jgi:MFS family permease
MNDRTGRFFYGWIVLAVGVGVVFGALGLARFGYTLVLPAMQHGLDIANTEAGVLATANLVGYLLLSVVGGALASRFGPRIVISAGLALAGFGMLLTGCAQGFFTVALWRGLTGIGSGASNVPVMGLLSSWFGKRKRGFATGITVSGSSVALILLGLVVPRLLTAFGDGGWRICWFLFGGITLLVAVGAVVLLRNHPSEKGTKPLGEDDAAVDDPKNESSTSPGLGSVYTSPIVWFMGLIYVAFGFSYIIYMTFFFKHLITEGGYTRESAGNLFMLVGWLSLFCGVIWGTVSDRLGRKHTLAIVYLLQAVAFSLFALWPEPPGFLLSSVIFGLTAWSIPAIMAAACGDVLGAKMAPAALGFITLFFGIGQAVGPSVAGAIADATGTFNPAFLLAGIAALFGAAGSLFLKT